MSLEHTQQHYDIQVEGEKPLPLLKQLMDESKENGTHPISRATGYELISIPEKQPLQEFIRDFLMTKAEVDKVYIAILKLGAIKSNVISTTVMTGKCTVKDNITKGARKWETKHVVYYPVQVKDVDGVPLHDEAGTPVTRNVEIGTYDTKGDAMAFAKQYAIDHDTEVFVEIEKRLNGSLHRVADITPMKKNVQKVEQISTNRFLFMGRGA